MSFVMHMHIHLSCMTVRNVSYVIYGFCYDFNLHFRKSQSDNDCSAAHVFSVVSSEIVVFVSSHAYEGTDPLCLVLTQAGSNVPSQRLRVSTPRLMASLNHRVTLDAHEGKTYLSSPYEESISDYETLFDRLAARRSAITITSITIMITITVNETLLDRPAARRKHKQL